MQGWGQVLGPCEGAIVYSDCIAWEGQGMQGQRSGARQGGGGRERYGDPWGRGPREKAGMLGAQ